MLSVNENLKREQVGPWHDAILSHVKPLLKQSRSDMARSYEGWDAAMVTFKGETVPDNEDKRNLQQKRPVKMVVPHTYAQVMTWVSFNFLFLTQNANFFSLDAGGPEDDGVLKACCEKVLNDDLKQNAWLRKLFQGLLDTARFGVGVYETGWTRETTSAFFAAKPEPITIEGLGTFEVPAGAPTWQEVLRREGNDVKNVSPYRFFPDTRLPLCDFQRGEFCASEEDFSMHELRQMEKDGLVFGLDHIQPMSKTAWGARETTRSGLVDRTSLGKFSAKNESHYAVVTKMQLWLTPSKFTVEGKKKLGEENFPVLFIVWIANDNRIIRFEPAVSWHGRFSWAVSQFSPDSEEILINGLASLVDHLQSVISWFINSHIRSVNRVVENRMIVNPMLVDTTSLDGRGDIFVKRNVNVPLDRVAKQLSVQDETGGHINDSALLQQLMGIITGVNDNAMGQYNGGRRSATEARVVTSASAGRMKMSAMLMFESAFAPLGQMHLSNLRQSLSWEMFKRIMGTSATVPLEALYSRFQGEPEDIISSRDYFIMDTQLAAEKGYVAQSLQELLGLVLSNPETGPMFDISAKGLLEEIQRLRGAGDISRFSLSQRIARGEDKPPQSVPAPVPVQ